jgi:RimJ/RimL family protein N-acetyltransferase
MVTTANLVLDSLKDKDQEAITQILTNNKIKETYVIPDLDANEAEKLFKKLKLNSKSNGHYVRGIFKDGKLIGLINENGRLVDKRVDLSLAITPEEQGKGYASEALKAAIDELFSLGYEEISSYAFRTNLANIHVLEKCEMKKLPREEKMHYRDRDNTVVFYTITK